MRTGGKFLGAAVLILLLTTAGSAQAQTRWKSIFDGKTLEGWTPKIVGHPAGDNFQETFVVKDGAIQVSYAGYDRFANRFGHLFYKTPFSAYRLRLEYRVLEPSLPDTPGWARGNSGVMFHAQSPSSMTLSQSFPVSLELQILGRDGEGPRPTGSVCTPGTNITIDGVMAKTHCITSSGPTIPNQTWTRLELEVSAKGEVTHRINGQVVHRYAGLELDPADLTTRQLIAENGGLTLTSGYVALQSEGHPIAFRKIQVREIAPYRPSGKPR
jgi:Domain of Unknown Function (DUF1080)